MGVEHQVDDVIPDTNRSVWVISNINVPEGMDEKEFWYKERYRGKLIEIPPSRKKYTVMPFLAAQKFLGVTSYISEPYPNGGCVNPDTEEVELWRLGKPLEVVEFTSEEREKFDGLTSADVMKRLVEIEEEQKAKKHVPDGAKNVTAVGKGKPQAQGTRRRRMPSSSEASEEINRIDVT